MGTNDDADFDIWLTSQADEFNAAMREGVDSQAILREIKRKASVRTRQEIERRVSVAAVTGTPPAPEPAWPQDRWERADSDFAQLADGALAQSYVTWLNLVRSRNAWMHMNLREESETSSPLIRQRCFDEVSDYNELLTAMTQGQQGALKRIITLVEPLVRRYSHAVFIIAGKPLHLSEEPARVAFVSLLTALPNYRRDEQPFLRFAYKVVKQKVRVVEDETAEGRVDDGSVSDGVTSRLTFILRKLRGQQREVVILRIFVGLSSTETAEALGLTPERVRLKQHEALSLIRRKLGKLGDVK